jgi:type 1 glutamine amidotransferase
LTFADHADCPDEESGQSALFFVCTSTGYSPQFGSAAPVRRGPLWNRRVGKCRVYVNILGHYNWSFNDPHFRLLVFRGIAWAAGEPADRFSRLADTDVQFKE